MDPVRLDSLEPLGWAAPAVTVGNFDGVHRGHRALVAAAVEDARASGGTAVALTFDPHPSRVLSPDRAPQSLMTLAQKVAALEALGIARVAVLPFTTALSQHGPEQFAREVLAAALGARLVVVGSNFRFGRGRRGTPDELATFGRQLGFRVHAVEPVFHDGAPISSTRVREALARGAVEDAAGLLGARYRIEGRVVAGDRRGRTLGFPTANLISDNGILPARGVYAGWARVAQGAPEATAAVVNVGHRPTFGGGRLIVEAHLLDWERDLYGERLGLEFAARLRGERAFPGPQALREQIGRDVEEARRALERA